MYLDFIFFAVVLITGILMLKGKGEAVIMWFITKPRYQKEQIDSLKLCKFIGKLVTAAAGCVLLWIIGELTDIFMFTVIGLVALIVIAIFGYFYTHTGNRFNKK